MSARRAFSSLYLQVSVAIVAGALLGHLRPHLGESMRPLGEGFIKLIRMLIAPIVFSTIVGGIAQIGDIKKVGRVGLKALIYFELMTTLALTIGLVVVRIVRPGAGMNIDPTTLDPHALDAFTRKAAEPHHASFVDFVMNTIPTSAVDAFAQGDILQVLVFSLIFGLALSRLGDRGKPLALLVDQLGKVLFSAVALIMRLAPAGAFGAMAFTAGKYGLGSLAHLGKLMAAFYVSSLLFVFVVLGLVTRCIGVNLWSFLKYIREEILIVLGTSSSESALPGLIEKMEALGCSRSVVGLVVPTGYSFNLDGTSIYLTMAALFVAQATNTQLTLGQQLSVLGLLLLTSKGAATVTGGGFITLASTLASTGTIPVAGIALLLGIDRFMSEARAVTNLVGNGVATMVVARWENELDPIQARQVLNSYGKAR